MRPAERNTWLDVVRCVAIALVLLRHGYRAYATDHGLAPGFAGNLMLNGWVGVDLFFVLSGYLIARQLTTELRNDAPFDYAHYLVRRALRIVPSYFAVLFLIVAGAFPLYAFSEQDLGLRVFYHVLFLQDYLPSDINVVFWTLGVEEKFYLLAPLLIALCLRTASARATWIILGAVLLISPLLRFVTLTGNPPPYGYEAFFRAFRSPFHASLEPLVLGVAIAVAQASGHFDRLSGHGPRLFGLAAVALILWLGSHEFLAVIGRIDALLQPALIAALCTMLTLGAVLSAGLPIPGARLAQIGARLSYALYLVHYPLIPLAIVLSRPATLPTAAFWILFLGFSLLAALLLHLCVERPFLAYRDRLIWAAQPRLDRS